MLLKNVISNLTKDIKDENIINVFYNVVDERLNDKNIGGIVPGMLINKAKMKAEKAWMDIKHSFVDADKLTAEEAILAFLVLQECLGDGKVVTGDGNVYDSSDVSFGGDKENVELSFASQPGKSDTLFNAANIKEMAAGTGATPEKKLETKITESEMTENEEESEEDTNEEVEEKINLHDLKLEEYVPPQAAGKPESDADKERERIINVNDAIGIILDDSEIETTTRFMSKLEKLSSENGFEVKDTYGHVYRIPNGLIGGNSEEEKTFIIKEYNDKTKAIREAISDAMLASDPRNTDFIEDAINVNKVDLQNAFILPHDAIRLDIPFVTESSKGLQPLTVADFRVYHEDYSSEEEAEILKDMSTTQETSEEKTVQEIDTVFDQSIKHDLVRPILPITEYVDVTPFDTDYYGNPLTLIKDKVSGESLHRFMLTLPGFAEVSLEEEDGVLSAINISNGDKSIFFNLEDDIILDDSGALDSFAAVQKAFLELLEKPVRGILESRSNDKLTELVNGNIYRRSIVDKEVMGQADVMSVEEHRLETNKLFGRLHAFGNKLATLMTDLVNIEILETGNCMDTFGQSILDNVEICTTTDGVGGQTSIVVLSTLYGTPYDAEFADVANTIRGDRDVVTYVKEISAGIFRAMNISLDLKQVERQMEESTKRFIDQFQNENVTEANVVEGINLGFDSETIANINAVKNIEQQDVDQNQGVVDPTDWMKTIGEGTGLI